MTEEDTKPLLINNDNKSSSSTENNKLNSSSPISSLNSKFSFNSNFKEPSDIEDSEEKELKNVNFSPLNSPELSPIVPLSPDSFENTEIQINNSISKISKVLGEEPKSFLNGNLTQTKATTQLTLGNPMGLPENYGKLLEFKF
jgi:hypothetical protein